mmetsp:Transcript_29766/g.22078  ORF Transcript_29766/g.22078 Transcript_29766/m.22078 type:complete len:80 (+) Transcript_29766:498-737(+)
MTSGNVNCRFLNDDWLNQFDLVEKLGYDVLTETYKVRMKKTKEMRVLRRLKKVVFKGQEMDDYRYMLEDWLTIDHPYIA